MVSRVLRAVSDALPWSRTWTPNLLPKPLAAGVLPPFGLVDQTTVAERVRMYMLQRTSTPYEYMPCTHPRKPTSFSRLPADTRLWLALSLVRYMYASASLQT